jgi:hypothetical protein
MIFKDYKYTYLDMLKKERRALYLIKEVYKQEKPFHDIAILKWLPVKQIVAN